MMKRKIYQSGCAAFLFSVTFSHGIFAQDIHFSQFYFSPLTLNPALAGTNGDLQVQTNYKNQWRSVADAYKTFSVSFDMKFMQKKWKNGFMGVGLNIFNDKAGDAKMGISQANISLSSARLLNPNNIISGGIQGGFSQHSINYSALVWENQYDPNTLAYNPSLPSGEPSTGNKFSYADMSAGLQWNYGKGEMYISGNDQILANFGVAIFHINQPKYTYYGLAGEKLYQRMVAHGKLLYGIKNTPLSLVPSFIFFKQGPTQEINPGCMIRYTLKENSKYTNYVNGAAISGGAHYRFKDAAVVSVLLEIANWAIGVSYDINTSDLTSASNGRGGIEVALRYINPNPFFSANKARFN